MNQETLNIRVQLLMQRKWNGDDVNQQASRHLASSTAPSFTMTPTYGMPNISCNSSAPDPPVNYHPDVGINMSMIDNTNLSQIPEGEALLFAKVI